MSAWAWARNLTVTALLGGAVVGLSACGGDDGASPPPTGTTASATTAASPPPTGTTASATTAAASDGLSAIPQDLADGFALGKKDARLTLVVYEDFQCPFCLRYTTAFESMLVEDYVKPGKLRIEFRNLPILGPESVAAARGAVCAAAQNRFWEYHHRLFADQLKAGQLTNEKLNIGRFSNQALRAIVEETGLSALQWQACFDDPASLQVVQEHAREATALGLRSTPSLVLNGKPTTIPQTVAAFRKVLDDALKSP